MVLHYHQTFRMRCHCSNDAGDLVDACHCEEQPGDDCGSGAGAGASVTTTAPSAGSSAVITYSSVYKIVEDEA